MITTSRLTQRDSLMKCRLLEESFRKHCIFFTESLIRRFPNMLVGLRILLILVSVPRHLRLVWKRAFLSSS